MKLDKKQILLIVVIVFMLGIFFFLQYMPTMEALKEAKEEKQQKQFEQARVQSQMEKLPELIAQLDKIKSEIGDFDKKIPDQARLGEFLQDVSSVMNKYSLSNQMVRPSEEKSFEDIAVIPVDIECMGSLEQVFKFFNDMESNERIFRLEQIRFENTNYSGQVKVYAKVNIFYRQDT